MKSQFLTRLIVVGVLAFASMANCAAQTNGINWKIFEGQGDSLVEKYKEQHPYAPFYEYAIKKIEFAAQNFISTTSATARDMRACELYKMQSYDQLLNQYYQRLMGMLNPQQKEELRDVQRLWLKFYEKNTVSCSKLETIVNRDNGLMVFPVTIEGRANTLKYRVEELGWMINYLKDK